MLQEGEESTEERPITPSRRRINMPILRLQSRHEEIRLACLKGDVSLLQSLTKEGNDSESVNELFEDGWSPLMVAANGANPTIVKFLLMQGADPNKCRTDRFSPLMAALTSSKDPALVQQCVQLLIDAGADVSCRSDDGLAPLLLAVKDNRVPVVDLLVFHGADLTAKDNAGRTSSQLATERKFDKILITLEKHDRSDVAFVDEVHHNPSKEQQMSKKEKEFVEITDNLGTKSEIMRNNKATSETSAISISEPFASTPDTTCDNENEANASLVKSTFQEILTPQEIQEEILDSLEMVKKDNELSDMESNKTDSIPSQELSKIEDKCQNAQMNKQPEELSTSFSSSKVPSENRGNDGSFMIKIGIVVGLIASLLGVYYAKVYMQKR